jgi:hypothetical protein
MVGLAVLLVVAAGCGGPKDPHGRLPLSGTVTFQEQPLDAGTIEFLPLDPNNRFSARTMIAAGKFQVPREQGLPPGTYRVLITSPTQNESAEPVGPPGFKMPPLATERIPAQYNKDSKKTVEVKADVENSFDFDIR